jgi:hypothetical protein
MKTSHLLAPTMLALSLLPVRAHASDFRYIPPPAAQQQGDVTYLSGGVTIEERKVMRPMARDYNLKLEFANGKGQYLADVKVAVKDAKGNVVFAGVSSGPWLYMAVPAGTYEVSAAGQKNKFVKTSDVADSRLADVLFYLKETPINEATKVATMGS